MRQCGRGKAKLKKKKERGFVNILKKYLFVDRWLGRVEQ
jgi:hypothetical protein